MNEQTSKEITNVLTNSQKKTPTQLFSHVEKALFFFFSISYIV